MTRERAFRIAEKTAAYGPFVDGHVVCHCCGQIMTPVGSGGLHALRGHLIDRH